MNAKESERMRQLVSALNEAADAYYNQNRPVMSDREYDKLYDELAALERRTNTALALSPTRRVGAEAVSALLKVRHEAQMLSLDKTKETEKLTAFLGDRPGLLSLKLDGLTIVLSYENGLLSRALTRGNGIVGEDITHNARTFVNLPQLIDYPGKLTVRGEALISLPDFERINAGLGEDEQYKNPRNLASGTVRQLNNAVCAGRGVRFIAFSVSSASGPELPDSRLECFALLKRLGFDVVEHAAVDGGGVAGAVEKFKQSLARYPFATDGLVLSFDSVSYGASLGATSKFPRDSIAYKWADETAETALIDVEWNTSRTGLINPVAVFEPVELEGTTVNRASLHNVSIFEGLRLGAGDIITVYKANMIIPQVAENLTASGTCEIPKNCPVCGFVTVISQENDAKTLLCENSNCRAQTLRAITHYSSRDAMNIEGLSEATAEKFIEQGFIENYADLYGLDGHREAIIALPGFGERSYANLSASIERSKDAALPNFIYALGIHNVGLANAKLLCAHFDGDLDSIIRACRGPDAEEELSAIYGFGAVIAQALRLYFSDDRNIGILNRALPFLRIRAARSADAENNALSGKTFVITGDTVIYAGRRALQSAIERRGGRVTSSVTSKTDYLINNDAASNSSKNKKARELGVAVISESDFIEMAGGAADA